VNWLTVVASLVATVFGVGGGATVINALARRNVTKVEAAARLSDSAMEIVDQVRADTRADVAAARDEAREARAEAGEARRAAAKAREEAALARDEAAEAHRQVRAITREVAELAGFLAQLMRWIQSPDMSIEQLRVLAGQTGPIDAAG
jgi:uncharacterized protein (DUF3084 family)